MNLREIEIRPQIPISQIFRARYSEEHGPGYIGWYIKPLNSFIWFGFAIVGGYYTNVKQDNLSFAPDGIFNMKRPPDEQQYKEIMDFLKSQNKLQEQRLPQPHRQQLIREFVKFCIQEAGIKQPIKGKIVLTNDPKKTETYAHYQPSVNEIVVYKGNRAFGDYARSLAHEIFHLSSNQKGTLHAESGADGSDEENNANSFSGVVMRKWGKLHPESLEK